MIHAHVEIRNPKPETRNESGSRNSTDGNGIAKREMMRWRAPNAGAGPSSFGILNFEPSNLCGFPDTLPLARPGCGAPLRVGAARRGGWGLFRISNFVLRICLCGFALAGCAAPAAYEKTYYILKAARQAAPVEAHTDATLEVRRFSVDAAFADKGLVYRLDEFKYESDYYHQFLIAPGIMITEKTRAWLADSGLFAHVLPAGSRPQATYTLEGSVTALYGDFTNESAPTAVMEIRFFLLSNTDAWETVAFAETYRAATPVPARTADALVAALNESLTEILTRLEADLQRTLADKTDTAAAARGS